MVRPLRLLAVLAMGVALATATGAAAIAIPPPPTTIEDQDDRRPLNPLVEEARRSRAAVELFRSGERNFVPEPDIIGDVAAPPSARPVPDGPVPAVPRPGIGVVASLLLGLVGGVVGGCAALAGWIVMTRRRLRQPARRVAANLATSGLRRRLVEARALARLAARREPALDPLPAENADFWRAVRALPQRQAQAVHRIDIATGAVTARPTTELDARIRVGQGGMWVMSFDGKVLRADRRTGRIVAQVPGAFRAADLAVGAEGVWVYDQHQGAVLRIDPATNRVARTIPVISQPLVEVYSRVLALGDGAVWVVDKAGEALVRVDPNR